MNLARFRFVAFAFLALFIVAPPGSGQSTKMPSTLRYGSGILDIPVGSVLPHKAFTATYSGFGISIDQTLLLRRNGEVRRRGFGYDKWLSDMSLALGLFDRVEVGATIQHIDDEADGGNMLGGFGRISLLPSTVENLDLAVGARYVSSPSFGARWVDDLQPPRFGHPDYRTRQQQGQGDEFNSNLSPYVVGTAILPTSDASFISLTLGWGAGLFSAGGDLDFYAQRGSGGLFAGSTVHVGMDGGRGLNLMAEFNGFDVNAGVQMDFGGIRVGAFSLSLAGDGHTTFRTRKLGVLASMAVCPGRMGLCGDEPPPPPPPPPPADPGPTAEELEQMRQDSIRRAQAEEERRLAAEREQAEREREQRAMEARRTLQEMVYFQYDDATVDDEAGARLRAKATILQANPGVRIRIEGHADERGDPTYNLELSRLRAESVLDFLAELGLNRARFTVEYFGEDQPRVPGTDEETWAQNRRVEFVITAGGDDIGR
jgi:peptidoglycan-associated lipoprotein